MYTYRVVKLHYKETYTMSHKFYCAICGQKSKAQRSSAKYCSESCKQRAKYQRADIDAREPVMSDLEYKLVETWLGLDDWIKSYLHERTNPELLASRNMLTQLSTIRHKLDEIEAKIGVIESDLDNSWYQCLECGQKVFARHDACDFCTSKDFKRIN